MDSRPKDGGPLRVALVDGLRDGDLLGAGSRRVLLDLAAGLDRARFEPLVVVASEGRFADAAREAGAAVALRRTPPPGSLYGQLGRWVVPNPAAFARTALAAPAGVRDLADLFRQEAADVACLSSFLVHVEGGLAARLAGVPAVAHLQGIVQAGHRVRLMRPAYRAFLTALDIRPVAISRAVADSLGGEVRVVRNGVDTDRWHPAPADPRPFQALGVPLDGRPLVGLVSRLSPLKGLLRLPAVARAVLDRRPDARFLACGAPEDDAFLARLRADLAAAGVADRVVLAGHRDDVPDLVRGMDVVLHLCAVEAFGLSVAEAMASGRAVVAVDAPGLREVVLDGLTGCLVRGDGRGPAPDAAVADAVVALLADPARRRRLGTAAREDVEARFSRRAFLSGWESVLEDAVRPGGPRPGSGS